MIKFQKKFLVFCVSTLILIAILVFSKRIIFHKSSLRHRVGGRIFYYISHEFVSENPYHKPLISSSPLSKEMVVHCAIFDSRHRDGHDNATIFFITASQTILNNHWITGCGVRSQTAQSFKVRIPAEWWWIHGWRFSFKHRDLSILCYDLPVNNGDTAFIIYKAGGVSEYTVESNQPARVPSPKIVPDDEYQLSILASLKANSNGAPFIGELILYQKTLGVDHVLFDILSTYIKDGGLKNLIIKHPKLHQYILDGYVTVDVWKTWYNDSQGANDIRLWSESIRKVSSVYKYRDTYDFALTFDTDDFFVSRLPDKKNIKYYLKNFCSSYPIGSCMFKWITYYPEFCGLNETPEDYNLTKSLKSLKNEVNESPKSIHSTAALLDSSFHDARPHWGIPNLIPGYKVVEIDPMYAYVAHIRKFATPSDGQC